MSLIGGKDKRQFYSIWGKLGKPDSLVSHRQQSNFIRTGSSLGASPNRCLARHRHRPKHSVDLVTKFHNVIPTSFPFYSPNLMNIISYKGNLLIKVLQFLLSG